MNDMSISINHDVAIVPIFNLKNIASDGVSGHRLNEIHSRVLETDRIWTTELAYEEVLKIVYLCPSHLISRRSIWNHINDATLIS